MLFTSGAGFFAIRNGGFTESGKFFARMVGKISRAADVASRFIESNRADGPPIFASAVRSKCKKSQAAKERAHRVNNPVTKKPEPPKKPEFERSLARLEEVVRKLESPQLSLDEAMKLFEEGVALSRECQKQLEEAEGKVEILLKKADGKLAAEPFDPEGDES